MLGADDMDPIHNSIIIMVMNFWRPYATAKHDYPSLLLLICGLDGFASVTSTYFTCTIVVGIVVT